MLHFPAKLYRALLPRSPREENVEATAKSHYQTRRRGMLYRLAFLEYVLVKLYVIHMAMVYLYLKVFQNGPQNPKNVIKHISQPVLDLINCTLLVHIGLSYIHC